MKRLLCLIAGHRWDRMPCMLQCGCGDTLWYCTRCGKVVQTPFYRAWGCKVHTPPPTTSYRMSFRHYLVL